MTVKIIPIGNSAGIILPRALLKKYGLGLADRLEVEEKACSFSLEKEVPDSGTLPGPFTGPFAALKADTSIWDDVDMEGSRVNSDRDNGWL